MKRSPRLQLPIGQFITRKARSFTPLQRVLVTISAVLAACLFFGAVAVAYITLSGALISDPATASERDLIVAQQRYKEQVQQAKEQGVSVSEYTPALRAKARVALAQSKVSATRKNAIAAADDLIDTGSLDPFVLYACARVYASDSARASQARPLLAQAAHKVGDQAGELTRVIYADYAADLIKTGDDKAADTYLRKAAALKPASPALYLRLGTHLERQAQWYDAAIAYLSALKVDPQYQRAQRALAALEQRQPERVQAARAEMK